MKTSWEKKEGNCTYYIIVSYKDVCVGHHYGTGMSDVAGVCSHEEFLAGEFQSLITERFGNAILNDVIVAVRMSPQNPDHVEKRNRIQFLKSFINAIPVDPVLENLDKQPDTINGYDAFHKGSGKTGSLTSDHYHIVCRGKKVTLMHKPKEIIKELKLNFYPSRCIEYEDHFYFAYTDNLAILTPRGKIMNAVPPEQHIFGYELRIGNIYRYEDIIFFSYGWIGNDDHPGFIRYQPDKGFTGRIEIKV
jgi:hypothetical protein